MNELIAEFWGKDFLSKKDYVEYLDLEWDDLAKKMNLMDKRL